MQLKIKAVELVRGIREDHYERGRIYRLRRRSRSFVTRPAGCTLSWEGPRRSWTPPLPYRAQRPRR